MSHCYQDNEPLWKNGEMTCVCYLMLKSIDALCVSHLVGINQYNYILFPMQAHTAMVLQAICAYETQNITFAPTY